MSTNSKSATRFSSQKMFKNKSFHAEEINKQNAKSRNKRSLSIPYEPGAKWEGKIYKLVDGTNFDQYMAALGIGPVLRKIGNSVRPVIALRKNGKYYTLITASDFTTTIQRFELCIPFDEFTLDGRQMRTTFSLYNNVLIQHQMGDIPSTIVREFHEDKMIAKYMVKDVEAVRVFQAADEEMCRLIWEANVAKRYHI